MVSSLDLNKKSNVIGYNLALGIGTLVTEKLEVHLNGMYTQNPNIIAEESQPSITNKVIYKTNSMLVTLNFHYRI